MCIEDISEEQAQKILDFLARKLGFNKFYVEYYSSCESMANAHYYYCALASDDAIPYVYLQDRQPLLPVWHTFMFMSSCVSSKNALKAILDACASGHKIFIPIPNDPFKADFIPMTSTLESILIEYDLNGVVQKHVH